MAEVNAEQRTAESKQMRSGRWRALSLPYKQSLCWCGRFASACYVGIGVPLNNDGLSSICKQCCSRGDVRSRLGRCSFPLRFACLRACKTGRERQKLFANCCPGSRHTCTARNEFDNVSLIAQFQASCERNSLGST